MKKLILGVIACLVLAVPLYVLTQHLKAEPVQDYSTISPTVRILSYKLARNGDIYEALTASGTIISPDGFILTNSHVVLDERDDPYDVFGICLSFDENEEPVCEYSAFLMDYDENLDLALLVMSGLDNRGNMLPLLPYYDYSYQGEVTVGQTINIYGYSDIGGKTLTQTQGQVSGFEDQSGVRYIKTDTDISGGNSGGTALNEDGNFVGVPTYLLSSWENLGYVLDIKEAQEFIELAVYGEPQLNEQVYSLLKVKLNLLNDTKDTNYYEHLYYPQFSLTANEDWEWDTIERTNITLISESNEGDKVIDIQIETTPFAVTEEHLTEIFRISGLYTEYLSDYQEEETTFAGYPATLRSYNLFSEKNYNYILAFGYSLISISYAVDLENLERDLPVFNQVLESFTFIDEPINQPPVIETLAKSDPAFAISRADNWKIHRNQKAYKKDVIAYLFNTNAIYGEMSISYSEIDEDEKALDSSQALDRLVLAHQWDQVISKNDNIKLDGLSGWSITYITEGLEAEELNKVSEVYLRDGDYVYEIVYEDRIDSYNQNLTYFKQVLRSFKNYNQPEEMIGKGTYNFGSLNYVFPDIAYHRFEHAITDFTNKGLVYGYVDGAFRPEKSITAAEVKSFTKNSLTESKRTDVNEWGADFLLTGEVTLANALKALVQTYKLDIWIDTTNEAPEWKPYIDNGYEMGIIPRGLDDPDHLLTRAEFTYILYQLLESFETL